MTSSEEPLLPGTTHNPTTASKSKFNVNFQSIIIPNVIPAPHPPFKADRVKLPTEYFIMFFTHEMVMHVVEQSNVYGFQTKGIIPNITKEMIGKFIAVEILMGVCKMPAYADYWSPRFGYRPVAQIMTLKVYEYIRRNLHFADNSEDPKGFTKVHRLLELLRRECIKIPNESRQSIDEMMVAYKGVKAGKLKQYMPNKPIKWGFKYMSEQEYLGLYTTFICTVAPKLLIGSFLTTTKCIFLFRIKLFWRLLNPLILRGQ